MWKSEQSLFLTETLIVLVFGLPDNFWHNAFINTPLGSLIQKGTNNWFLERCYLSKTGWSLLKFGLQLLKDMVLEVNRNPFHNNLLKFGWEYTFMGKDWCTCLPSTIIFPKMLYLKCQFENLSELYIILLFTHFYALFI